jgi:hypothetical protein
VEVQIAEAQLPDLDSSAGNKSVKSPPYEEKSTQKGKVMIKKCYKTQNLLFFFYLSLQTSNQLTCYDETNYSYFVKIDDHNNKSDDVNTS